MRLPTLRFDPWSASWCCHQSLTPRQTLPAHLPSHAGNIWEPVAMTARPNSRATSSPVTRRFRVGQVGGPVSPVCLVDGCSTYLLCRRRAWRPWSLSAAQYPTRGRVAQPGAMSSSVAPATPLVVAPLHQTPGLDIASVAFSRSHASPHWKQVSQKTSPVSLSQHSQRRNPHLSDQHLAFSSSGLPHLGHGSVSRLMIGVADWCDVVLDASHTNLDSSFFGQSSTKFASSLDSRRTICRSGWVISASGPWIVRTPSTVARDSPRSCRISRSRSVVMPLPSHATRCGRSRR